MDTPSTMSESTFRTRLNSILKDNAIERYVGNKKKGKINTKRLYKINESKKMFKLKEERKGKDYSISFLLDVSGSMSGRMADMCESMGHVCNALKKTDIPFSVYTFSDVVRLVKSFKEKYNQAHVDNLIRKSKHLYFYTCGDCRHKDVPIPWDSNKSEVLCPDCNKIMWHDSNGGTNDALALHVVGHEVHKAYKKNILIVLTDGCGSNLDGSAWRTGKVLYSELKNNRTVINKLHKEYEGLILLGISLGGDFTDHVYGKQYSANIQNTKDIFPTVAKLLSRHIKRG